MHNSAFQYAKAFFESYVKEKTNPIIIEIGSQDVNGSPRHWAPSGSTYVGLDFAPGKSVDIVLENAYKYPFPDNYADIVISSSCFEHIDFFWLSFIEAMRILKPDGVMYINAPSSGDFHRFPTDNWRFYPDSSISLSKYANYMGYNTAVMESFTRQKNKIYSDNFNDFVAVFIKDQQYSSNYPDRIYNNVPKELEPVNIRTIENINCICRISKLKNEILPSETTLDCAMAGKDVSVCD